MGSGARRRGRFAWRGRGEGDGGDAPDDTDSATLADRLDAYAAPSTRTADEVRDALRRRPAEPPPAPRTGGHRFEETYDLASLYLGPEDDNVVDPDDPWFVLGVPEGADWSEVVAAHRSLARRHHPDRMIDASPEDRESNEELMRRVNVAYTLLRRLHSR